MPTYLAVTQQNITAACMLVAQKVHSIVCVWRFLYFSTCFLFESLIPARFLSLLAILRLHAQFFFSFLFDSIFS